MWSRGNGYQSSKFYRVHSGSEYTEQCSFLRQFVFSCRQVGDVYVPHSSASIILKSQCKLPQNFLCLFVYYVTMSNVRVWYQQVQATGSDTKVLLCYSGLQKVERTCRNSVRIPLKKDVTWKTSITIDVIKHFTLPDASIWSMS